MKKKALFFVLNGVGGAERMSLNIAKMLPSEEWNVAVAKITNPNTFQCTRIEDLIPRDMQVATVAYSGRIGFMINLYKIIKLYEPDVVFSSIFAINLRVMLMRKIFPKVKFIIRNDNYLDTLSSVKRLWLKRLYKYADCIVAQTDEMRDEMVRIGLPVNGIKVLQNIPDYDDIQRKSQVASPYSGRSVCRFVAAGRFSHDKGFDILLQAFAIVVSHIPNSELYILGDYNKNPEYYKELRGIAEEKQLMDNIVFTGYTDNPYTYIRNANVFVLSSRNEGLPNVLVEAMYLSVPVAATRCRPIIDRMVQDGVNGYLAETENAESLAEAMIMASRMESVKSVYKPAGKEEFVSLFK